MAEINPPLYLDQDDAYGADELGLPYRDLMGEGVVGAGDLAVTDGGSLKSSVAAGAAWVTGDDDPAAQPTYRVRNDAAVLLQHDAADATNPRIDLVIAEVLDATFSGVSKLWRLRAVKGTPAPSPVAPALPSNAIPLAEVTIPAGSGTLGTITDRRSRAKVGAGAALGAAPMIVRGEVNSDGTKLSGTGFSSSRSSLGVYVVTFSPAFSASPVLVATASPSSDNVNVVVTVNSASQATLGAFSANTAGAVDRPVYFIAIAV